MDDANKYFNLLIGRQVSVAVVDTSHVTARYRETVVKWVQCSPHHYLLGNCVSIYHFAHLLSYKSKTASSECEFLLL